MASRKSLYMGSIPSRLLEILTVSHIYSQGFDVYTIFFCHDLGVYIQWRPISSMRDVGSLFYLEAHGT